jgi:RNA exonuclease 4
MDGRRPVTDYRFAETGLNPACLSNAPAFANVKQDVAHLIYNKIIVGYNIWDFLSVRLGQVTLVHSFVDNRCQVMGLKHPASHTRDVALFLPFRKSIGSKHSIPLPQLIQHFMNRRIGPSFENPVCTILVRYVAQPLTV